MASNAIKLPILGGNIPNGVHLVGKATIGASGAISAITPNGTGFAQSVAADGSAVQAYLATITHTAAGTYVIAPAESYIKIAYCSVQLTSQAAPGVANTLQIRKRPYDSSANSQTVVIVDTAAADVATNPASGDQIDFHLVFVTSASPIV